jgi:hypothetical protein
LAPKDEEDILHRGEAASTLITIILLGLILLRGDVAVIFPEHVALLDGVVDWGLVVRARLLQHVVKHIGASWGRSRALAGWVDREGLALILVAPLHMRVAAGLLSLLSPLVLLLGILGLATLHGCVVHALALFAVENDPHRLLYRSEALVAMSNNSLESTGGLRPSSHTRS